MLHRIQFYVDEVQFEMFRFYAYGKGFKTPSILAHKALFAYCERLPLNERQMSKSVQHFAPEAIGDELQISRSRI